MSAELPLLKIKEEVVECRKCPRLVWYREIVAREKKTGFLDWTYWGKPVPGFGDPNAILMIVGLAPAAHGGNRTGRVFTGDKSGDFLFKCLFKAGYANQPISKSRTDGLRLSGVYMTAAVKCVPPQNKPTGPEAANCSMYLRREVEALNSLKAILCLGQFAFRAVMAVFKDQYGVGRVKAKFEHSLELNVGGSLPSIFLSYHPSPRNTQTGKLTETMLLSLLRRIRDRAL